MNWFQTRAAGEAAERRLALALRRRGWRVSQMVGRESFDLLLLSTVEVKHDRIAAHTGKLAVEIECRDRPSGIMTSQADAWAFVCGDTAIVVNAATLRERIRKGDWQERACGDGERSVVRLAPIDDVLALAGAQLISLCDSV